MTTTYTHDELNKITEILATINTINDWEPGPYPRDTDGYLTILHHNNGTVATLALCPG